ncbi:MAG: PIG-L family deacetylase [Minisyncoccales bacterium]
MFKRTGKYAGIGIGTVYNHFYKNNDKVSLNKNTKFFINGSTGLNSFYFEGIKAGVKKANEIFEHELPLKNIVHSKFKDSTEGVQKGLIFYYQNLIKNNKKNLPEDDSNIILSDEVLPPSLKTWPIVEGKEVIVLEKKKGDAEIFGGNLIRRLKKDNVVKKISIGKWKRKTFKPDLILAPENLNITTDRPILFYRTFPSSKEELKFNSYFGFNSLKYLLEPIKAYQEELKRVRYDLKSKFNAQYYGELLKYFSISKSKFAYIFDIRKVEKGKIEKIKGIASIKKIINSSQGKNIFISPHADDMEISAGALVRWMIEKGEDIENWIITESHNEKERREREAIKAKEILSTKNKKLKLDFMGFNKKNLLKEEVKEKIKYQIKDINNLKIVFLPSLKDSHPTHQKVRKIIEEMFLEVFDEFLIVYYSSPWIGEYNTYFLSDKNHEKGKESKIGSLLKKSIGKSGIVGELCGDFKEKGFFKNYAEQFKRN